MRRVLTIALVALLATATLFAGVNFSGRFRQGYTFTFTEGEDPTSKPWKTEEAKLIMKFSDDNGIWTVNLKNTGALDSNDKWAANASVDFTKALELAGVNTGDFGLKLSLGHNEKMTGLSAYTDPTGNEYFKLKNNGKESIQIATSYGKLVEFNFALDPTNRIGKEKKDLSLVASVKSEPITGLAVAAAYAYNGYYTDAVAGADVTAKNMIGFSADINIAKLTSLDFKLGVSAFDNIALGDSSKNSFAANVYGGIDVVDGFVEFVMNNEDNANTFGLNTQVNLNLVDNLGLDAYFNIANLEKTGDTFIIGGDVSYTFAGIEFALNAEYARADKAFSLTPKMIILF